jgi:hypothetical protein
LYDHFRLLPTGANHGRLGWFGSREEFFFRPEA